MSRTALLATCPFPLLLCFLSAKPVLADTATGSALPAPTPPWYEVGGQITAIDQQAFPFRSPYSGTNSFQSSFQNALTHTYTLYLGVRPLNGLELYLDPEMALGYGLSGAVGLAGVANGDVIRQGGGAVKPGLAPSESPWGSDGPYIARAFARVVLPLGSETEDAPAAENQMGAAPWRRRVDRGVA